MRLKQFNDIAEEFLQDLELNNRSPNTLRAYTTDIIDFTDYCLDSKIKKIEKANIKSYFIHLKRKGLSSTSMKRKCASLGKLFGDMFPSEINPKTASYLPDVLTDDEIIAVEKQIKNDIEYVIFNLPLVSGLRISEFQSLDTGDIEAGKFKVTGKGSKDRMVYLTEKLYKKIDKMRKKPDEPLLTNRYGNRLSQVSIRKVIKVLIKKAGVDKDISAHSLRHTFATRLLREGINIVTISKLLGHSDVKTTMRYLHISDIAIEGELKKKANWDKVT